MKKIPEEYRGPYRDLVNITKLLVIKASFEATDRAVIMQGVLLNTMSNIRSTGYPSGILPLSTKLRAFLDS